MEITIFGGSFGLSIAMMVLVSSMDGRVASEGFWTHDCGFLAAIWEILDNVLRTLSANQDLGGSEFKLAGVDFSASGRESRGTLKSRFISW